MSKSDPDKTKKLLLLEYRTKKLLKESKETYEKAKKFYERINNEKKSS